MNISIPHIIAQESIEAAQRLIADHTRFVVTSHMSPDGDALGSSLGMARYLALKGKEVKIVFNDTPGENLSFVPQEIDIIGYDKNAAEASDALREAEVIVCLDFNLLTRVGDMHKLLSESPAHRLLIDHHLDPETAAFDVCISHPEMCATCELVYHFIAQSGDDHLLDAALATSLYIGIMTDTGILSYNSSRPELYLVLARLLASGLDKESIHRAMGAEKERRLRLKGYVLQSKLKIDYPNHAAFISLSKAEVKRFNHQKGDSEGFVNIPLSLPEVMCSAFFREEANFVKVSLRSKDDYPVNIMAEKFFNGGGHKNAAGGEFFGSLQQAEQLFVKVLPLFTKYCQKEGEKTQ